MCRIARRIDSHHTLAAFLPLEVWFSFFKPKPHQMISIIARKEVQLYVGWRPSEYQLVNNPEVTCQDTFPLFSIPSRTLAGRLGSAVQLLDRSSASWASVKRSPHNFVGSPH